MKYRIYIQTIGLRRFEVEAENEEEARNKFINDDEDVDLDTEYFEILNTNNEEIKYIEGVEELKNSLY